MAKICGSQNIISFPVTRFWPTSISHSTLKIFMWLNLKSSNVPQQPISAWNCFTSCSICYLWPPADITVLTLQTKLTSSCRKPPPSKVSTCAPHTCLIWAPKWFDNLSFAPDRSGKLLLQAGKCCLPLGTFDIITLLVDLLRIIVRLRNAYSCPVELPWWPVSPILTYLPDS